MRKQMLSAAVAAIVAASLVTGCNSKAEATNVTTAADGTTAIDAGTSVEAGTSAKAETTAEETTSEEETENSTEELKLLFDPDVIYYEGNYYQLGVTTLQEMFPDAKAEDLVLKYTGYQYSYVASDGFTRGTVSVLNSAATPEEALNTPIDYFSVGASGCFTPNDYPYTSTKYSDLSAQIALPVPSYQNTPKTRYNEYSPAYIDYDYGYRALLENYDIFSNYNYYHSPGTSPEIFFDTDTLRFHICMLLTDTDKITGLSVALLSNNDYIDLK